MHDLISRQAALDALEKIDCSDGVGVSALKCDAIDDAVTAIKALPSAHPVWIPVAERLPEESSSLRTSYLATVTSDKWPKPSVIYVQWETTTVRGKEVSRWIWNDKLLPKYWNLVAWMPLPTPYLEGGQDG